MGVLLGPVEPAHAHAQIGANVVTKRQTAVMVEFFDKVFHSEPPSSFKRGSERKSAAERGGQENRPVLMREVGSISYYAARLPSASDCHAKQIARGSYAQRAIRTLIP